MKIAIGKYCEVRSIIAVKSTSKGRYLGDSEPVPRSLVLTYDVLRRNSLPFLAPLCACSENRLPEPFFLCGSDGILSHGRRGDLGKFRLTIGQAGPGSSQGEPIALPLRSGLLEEAGTGMPIAIQLRFGGRVRNPEDFGRAFRGHAPKETISCLHRAGVMA
jgi:hypothetical protein